MAIAVRARVHCAERTMRNGGNIMLAEIGINAAGEAGVYLWCRACHQAHFRSLDQLAEDIAALQVPLVNRLAHQHEL